jgi:hypothetical protein
VYIFILDQTKIIPNQNRMSLTADYILSENNKEDVKFTNSIYEYCKNNCFIPAENKHVVIAH